VANSGADVNDALRATGNPRNNNQDADEHRNGNRCTRGNM
jgi:hypothetical protein